eukprot:5981902-Lingulodinium_polyedra.AAC.1
MVVPRGTKRSRRIPGKLKIAIAEMGGEGSVAKTSAKALVVTQKFRPRLRGIEPRTVDIWGLLSTQRYLGTAVE